MSLIRLLPWPALAISASYIIAYEDGTILKNAVDPEEKWTDAQREYWGLAEECRAE
jgi:hypothetical protein